MHDIILFCYFPLFILHNIILKLWLNILDHCFNTTNCVSSLSGCPLEEPVQFVDSWGRGLRRRRISRISEQRYEMVMQKMQFQVIKTFRSDKTLQVEASTHWSRTVNPACTQIVLVYLKVGGHFMHICREIIQTQQSGQIVLFSCLVCNLCSFNTEKQYFEHLGIHLKKHKTVNCVFKDCD